MLKLISKLFVAMSFCALAACNGSSGGGGANPSPDLPPGPGPSNSLDYQAIASEVKQGMQLVENTNGTFTNEQKITLVGAFALKSLEARQNQNVLEEEMLNNLRQILKEVEK